jgi:hypothetical protein
MSTFLPIQAYSGRYAARCSGQGDADDRVVDDAQERHKDLVEPGFEGRIHKGVDRIRLDLSHEVRLRAILFGARGEEDHVVFDQVVRG